jgi:hypothetical protein
VDRGFLRTVLGLLRAILFASSRADPGPIRASG